jgi:hypothetical protein
MANMAECALVIIAGAPGRPGVGFTGVSSYKDEWSGDRYPVKDAIIEQVACTLAAACGSLARTWPLRSASSLLLSQ